jgi:hypothetical protein
MLFDLILVAWRKGGSRRARTSGSAVHLLVLNYSHEISPVLRLFLSPQISVQALFVAYHLFIWPIAEHVHQFLELLSLSIQLILLVCFTFMMGEAKHSHTMEGLIVGALSSMTPTLSASPLHQQLRAASGTLNVSVGSVVTVIWVIHAISLGPRLVLTRSYVIPAPRDCLYSPENTSCAYHSGDSSPRFRSLMRSGSSSSHHVSSSSSTI